MSPATTWTTVLKISVNGSEIKHDWYGDLIEARTELEFRLPSRTTVRFHDDGYAIASSGVFTLGSAVEIAAIDGDSDSTTLFKGEITGINVEQDAAAAPEVVITAHDLAFRLTRGTRIETYLNASYSDVVRKICQQHGLRASVSVPGGPMEYMLQADTDFALIDMIAERTGCDWWVDDSTLHMSAASSHPLGSSDPVKLVLGRNLQSFSVRASGLHADSVQVEGWDRKKQAAVRGSATTSGTQLRPHADLVNAYVSPGGSLNATAKVQAAGVSVQTDEEAGLVASSLRDQAVAGAVQASGVALECAALRPGRRVKVDDAGPTSGTYFVTKVEHVFRDYFTTRFVAGDRRPTTLVDTLSRPTGNGSSLQHLGLVVGVVSNLNDETKSGRIKVTYPSVEGGKESAWARMLTLGGGKKRGLVVMPEVNDEVLLGFEGGDLRQPVVLGGLFGDKSTIPKWDVKEGKVDGRRITSRLGHVVELKDGTSPDEEYILLQLAGEKHSFRLGKDKIECIAPAGVPFTLKLGDNASLAYDAAGNLTIKAVAIKLEASANLDLKAQAQLTAQAQALLQVKAPSTMIKGDMVQVESTGPMTVKGMPVAIN